MAAPRKSGDFGKSVLDNEDVLHCIFEHFRTFDPFDSQANNRSNTHLLWAALACKAFLDPALNVLWKSINTFLPLLKLLPTFQSVQDEYVRRIIFN